MVIAMVAAGGSERWLGVELARRAAARACPTRWRCGLQRRSCAASPRTAPRAGRRAGRRARPPRRPAGAAWRRRGTAGTAPAVRGAFAGALRSRGRRQPWRHLLACLLLLLHASDPSPRRCPQRGLLPCHGMAARSTRLQRDALPLQLGAQAVQVGHAWVDGEQQVGQGGAGASRTCDQRAHATHAAGSAAGTAAAAAPPPPQAPPLREPSSAAPGPPARSAPRRCRARRSERSCASSLSASTASWRRPISARSVSGRLSQAWHRQGTALG